MKESPNRTFAVLSYLEGEGKPVTATAVQKFTKLPLPLVTRILMEGVNAFNPEVEKAEINDEVTYRYTGTGVVPPPVKEKKAAPKKNKVPTVSAEGRPRKKAQPISEVSAQPAGKISTKKSIKDPAKKQASPISKKPTTPVKSTGKSAPTLVAKTSNKASVPDTMREIASALDKANWLNEEFKENFLGLVNSLKHKA